MRQQNPNQSRHFQHLALKSGVQRQQIGLVPLKETQTCTYLFSPFYVQKAYGKETDRRARQTESLLTVSLQGTIWSSGYMLYAE